MTQALTSSRTNGVSFIVVNLAAHSLTAKTTCTGELAVDWQNNDVYYSYRDGGSPHPNALDVYNRDTDTISEIFDSLPNARYYDLSVDPNSK